MTANPLLVREDVHTTPRRKLFTLFGIPWTATPQAWMHVVTMLIIGIVAAIGIAAR